MKNAAFRLMTVTNTPTTAGRAVLAVAGLFAPFRTAVRG
jgi:hypothetical protein